MSQIKNSFTDVMRRFSQRKEEPAAGVQKPKWPSTKGRRRPAQQKQQPKNVKARFSIKRPSLHQPNASHHNDTGKKHWAFLHRDRSQAHRPSPSFDLSKAIKWTSLSKKKNNRATKKTPAPSKPSFLRFRQR